MSRLIYGLVKVVNLGLAKISDKEWEAKVRFVARFTPPEPFWTGRTNIPKYPKFLAGTKNGTDDDQWNPPEGEADLSESDWGDPEVIQVGKTVIGKALYQYYFKNKKFRYGWFFYVRDVGGEWKLTDENDDMYSTWTLARPGHFLFERDEYAKTNLKCCQEAILLYGDKGCASPSVIGVFKSDCPTK